MKQKLNKVLSNIIVAIILLLFIFGIGAADNNINLSAILMGSAALIGFITWPYTNKWSGMSDEDDIA